jgi:hypothetical protein
LQFETWRTAHPLGFPQGKAEFSRGTGTASPQPFDHVIIDKGQNVMPAEPRFFAVTMAESLPNKRICWPSITFHTVPLLIPRSGRWRIGCQRGGWIVDTFPRCD